MRQNNSEIIYCPICESDYIKIRQFNTFKMEYIQTGKTVIETVNKFYPSEFDDEYYICLKCGKAFDWNDLMEDNIP